MAVLKAVEIETPCIYETLDWAVNDCAKDLWPLHLPPFQVNAADNFGRQKIMVKNYVKMER